MSGLRSLVLWTSIAMVGASAQAQAPTCIDRPGAATKVVGGSDAPAGLYPWIVQLGDQKSGGQICGGSLIAERWVLTAAHCFYYRNGTQRSRDDLYVQHGRLGRNQGDKVAIVDIFEHPQYHFETMANDVAIIRLAQRIPLGERSRLLLADRSSEDWMAAPGTCAATAGWGSMLAADPHDRNPAVKAATVLQHAAVPLRNHAQCDQALDEALDEGMICAGYPGGRIDSCWGDSGGPLAVQTGLTRRPWMLVGVVSFGEGCAAPGKLGVYSRVSHFRSWIAEIVEAAEPGAFDGRRAQ